MNQFSLFQYNMYILVHESASPVDLVYILLARVKAAESQRPKGTPIQTETIHCLSAVDALVRHRPTKAAEAVVHGAGGGVTATAATTTAAAGGDPAASKPLTRISM